MWRASQQRIRRVARAGAVFASLVVTPLIASPLIRAIVAHDSMKAILASGGGVRRNGVRRSDVLPTVRWAEDQPGCTFSRDKDGKYRYGLWSGDAGVVVAIDARELQLTRHRIEPVFALNLTISYRGATALDESPNAITLQLTKHFKIVRASIDPDKYVRKIQADADTFDHATTHLIARHPEKKKVQEARLQDYQKSVSELIEFLTRSSLRAAHLDGSNTRAAGWVFFDTDSKWLGSWKPQEEFLLSVPIGETIFEFPLKLPPEQGEVFLRQRK